MTKYGSRPMKIQARFDSDYTADIVQINSKSGLEGSNKNFAYAGGGKFGGIGLVQSFAKELVDQRIKVNARLPRQLLMRVRSGVIRKRVCLCSICKPVKSRAPSRSRMSTTFMLLKCRCAGAVHPKTLLRAILIVSNSNTKPARRFRYRRPEHADKI